MSLPHGNDGEAALHERAIRSLCNVSGLSLTAVRDLFVAEYERLQTHARVKRYLTVLTVSSVRGMLLRKLRLAAAAGSGPPPLRHHTLQRWEDDGGSQLRDRHIATNRNAS